ncbi:hypothetical protein VNO78_22800 [Psophocarpus tetragonolobus]|uniref:RNase H type-1 domain-containing protein n=1 Tax=Psophocarpus tetragonolobus TaxID=3891 RepID=A0AAN9S3S3_PSOTE
MSSLRLTLFRGFNTTSHNSLFLASLWWIWCWRNNLVLNSEKWDATYVLDATYHYGSFSGLLHKVKVMFDNCYDIRLAHVHRKSNLVADSLANSTFQMDTAFTIWNSSLLDIQTLLAEDILS